MVAVEMVESLDDLTVPDYILAETLTVLKLKESWPIAAKCADFLTNSSNISIRTTNPSEFETTLAYFTKNQNNLSFVDTLLIILCRKGKQSIMTFDREIKSIMNRNLVGTG